MARDEAIGDVALKRADIVLEKLSECDKNLLNHFLTIVEEVYETDFVTLQSIIRIKISENGASGELPESIQLDQLLHRSRPLILQKEKTFTPKIINLLCANIEDERFRKLMGNFIRAFKLQVHIKSIPIEDENNRLINDEAMFNNWLNGFIFHRQEDARKKLLARDYTFALGFGHHNYYNSLMQKLDVSQIIATFVHWLLNMDDEQFIFYGKGHAVDIGKRSYWEVVPVN